MYFMRYPERAVQRQVQGKVFVKFEIKTDGTTTDFSVFNEVDPDLAVEALRVVRSATNWVLATLKGMPVSAVFRVPVSFNLGY